MASLLLRHASLRSRRMLHPTSIFSLPRAFSTQHIERDASTISFERDAEIPKIQLERIVDGPSTRFGTGAIATLTDASVVGTAGKTVVLSTVATEYDDPPTCLAEALLQQAEDMVPLTVTFQERHHGVGRIPSGAQRRDTMKSTNEEVLASRAIDRALRPLCIKDNSAKAIHVTCSVQAHDVFEPGASGHPVALALNAASVAMSRAGLLKEPVACVHLCCMNDGTIIMDPTHAQIEESLAELLYAGTKEKVVMMECSSPTDRIPEATLVDLVRIAHASLEPIFDIQEKLKEKEKQEEADDRILRISLGLSSVEDDAEPSVTETRHAHDAKLLSEEAYQYCEQKLKDASLRLFGYTNDERSGTKSQDVSIHPLDKPLLSKTVRGRREHLIYTEILKLMSTEFKPRDGRLNAEYESLICDGSESISALARSVHSRLLRSAFVDTATKYKSRGDGRSGDDGDGCSVIRPVSLNVPALPDVVHGSAMFARGDTQVLCTATLGAPIEGIRMVNPYKETTDPRMAGTEGRTDLPKGPYDDLPVGSLRYVKSQEALASDLNSRKVKAEREMLGDSGTLDEVRRFFLHYDFPSYSTGEVPTGKGMSANRRAIGHGALAEKAVGSIIPPADEFPYTIRLTSEVTQSNGSSSLASVCGATLALLDAGVPIRNGGVAGVSVGLAMNSDNHSHWGLLLDITGTEDHYGAMDFKIAGTKDGVTALQLDVKEPLPMSIIVEALDLASAGRRAVLHEMNVLSEESSCGIITELSPRSSLKESAPRVAIVRFDPVRKRDLIGPGGAVLRQLEDRFGLSLDLTQEGQCLLFGADQQMVSKARSAVMDLVADVEEGEVYEGTVIGIRDFGAIIELLRNKEGLLHVSELSDEASAFNPKGNVGIVNDHLRIGQKIEVLCTGVDPVQGSIRLSRKKLLQHKRK